MNPQNTTTQKVGTKRITLIGAIVLSAAVLSVGFLAFPRFFTSDQGGGAASGAAPLKIADITRAFADVDQFGQFYSLVYRSGSKVVYTQSARVGDLEQPDLRSSEGILTIGRESTAVNNTNRSNIWNELLLLPKPAGAQTTPFSIEPIPFSGLPTQMLVISYRGANDPSDRYLTICVGKTDAQTVYVGTDGSTYTDRTLKRRTTNQPCTAITARAFVPTKITGGHVISEQTTLPNPAWRFIRFFIPLADFYRNTGFVPPEDPNQHVTLPSQTPLWAGYIFDEMPLQPTPAAMFRIEAEVNGSATTTTLCFPRLTVDPNTGGPLYYFDAHGTPFHDIMLTQKAMTDDCPALVAKSYVPASIASARTSPALPEVNSLVYTIGIAIRGKWIGVTSGTLWQTTDPEQPPFRNVIHPLNAFLAGGQGDTPVTIPTVNLTITEGSGKTATLCFPGGQNVKPINRELWYYYDASYRPYRDLFLTEPVICTPPTGGGSGGTPSKLPLDDVLGL